MPYIDIVFEEEMPSIPQVIVSSEFLFPFTPCAHGAMDAIDHRVNSLTTKGFRLYGGASPASTAISSCGSEPASGRAVSLFSWMAIAKKLCLPIRYVENEWRRRTYLQGIYDTWIFGQRRNNVCLPRGLYKDRVGYLRAGMAVQ